MKVIVDGLVWDEYPDSWDRVTALREDRDAWKAEALRLRRLLTAAERSQAAGSA